jgi:hypothetical protein
LCIPDYDGPSQRQAHAGVVFLRPSLLLDSHDTSPEPHLHAILTIAHRAPHIDSSTSASVCYTMSTPTASAVPGGSAADLPVAHEHVAPATTTAVVDGTGAGAGAVPGSNTVDTAVDGAGPSLIRPRGHVERMAAGCQAIFAGFVAVAHTRQVSRDEEQHASGAAVAAQRGRKAAGGQGDDTHEWWLMLCRSGRASRRSGRRRRRT